MFTKIRRQVVVKLVLGALALVMLAGGPIAISPVLAGDCPSTSSDHC